MESLTVLTIRFISTRRTTCTLLIEMPKCRPEIDEDLIRKIKVKFSETAMMGIAETVEWCMKTLLKETKS